MSADVTPTVPDKTPGGYSPAGSLQTLCESVAERLRTHALVAEKGIRVLPEYAGDFYNRLNQLLNKQLSVLMVVAVEDVDAKATGMHAAFKRIGVQVLCMENVLHNQAGTGAKVSALTLAELSCGWLHNFQHSDGQQLWMQEEDTLSRVTDDKLFNPAAGLVCYRARLFTQGCAKSTFE